jgi:sec-independent protein translocase protein TatB
VLGGLGWPETAVLLLLGLFVFGPERLPGIAQDAGRALRRMRTYLKGMGDDLKAELGPEVGDLDLRSLHPREFVRKHLLEDDEDLFGDGLPSRRAVLVPGEPVPWDPDTT